MQLLAGTRQAKHSGPRADRAQMQHCAAGHRQPCLGERRAQPTEAINLFIQPTAVLYAAVRLGALQEVFCKHDQGPKRRRRCGGHRDDTRRRSFMDLRRAHITSNDSSQSQHCAAGSQGALRTKDPPLLKDLGTKRGLMVSKRLLFIPDML